MSPPSDAFDRHLDAASRASIAVAYSGGGNSLMALKLTKAWADRRGRTVTAFSVDHRLQTASGEWIEQARETAERLEVGFQALAWVGEKPTTGVAAAARLARHRLIAEAARAAGARVIVFGHTADDVLEGEAMRAEGLRLGQLREWSPSPIWPEGRGLFLLRPLLGTRRAAIREALKQQSESWIDDPANADVRSPRARARISLANDHPERPSFALPCEDAALTALARQAMIGDDGAVRFHRQRLHNAPAATLRRLLAAALACAGGQAGPPRGKRLEALAGRLQGPETFTATLGGAKILADEVVMIVRDAGELRRGGLTPVRVDQGQSAIWDGRFEITLGPRSATVRALSGYMKALCDKDLQRLKAIHPAVRPSLPAMDLGDGRLTCPILAQTDAAAVRSLIGERFLAACGVFSKEAAT